MRCRYCRGLNTRVKDTRAHEELERVRRVRECMSDSCGRDFVTWEHPLDDEVASELVRMTHEEFILFLAYLRVDILRRRRTGKPVAAA